MMRPIVYLRIILVQAILAMSGSLYFSNFGDPIGNMSKGDLWGGVGFEPCHLCWWARILMYPLVWITLIGLLRKDVKIAYTILPISLVGVGLTTYHYIIQYVNSLNVFTCAPGNPCTLIDWKIGFITIPALARIAFVVISLCATMIIVNERKRK